MCTGKIFWGGLIIIIVIIIIIIIIKWVLLECYWVKITSLILYTLRGKGCVYKTFRKPGTPEHSKFQREWVSIDKPSVVA